MTFLNLSIGYLLNQNMISNKTKIEAVDYEADLRVIVIRTKKKTNFEIKLRKKQLLLGMHKELYLVM